MRGATVSGVAGLFEKIIRDIQIVLLKFVSGVAIFTKKHHRSPSHFNLKYGRENSPPDSPVREIHPISSIANGSVETSKEGAEVVFLNCFFLFGSLRIF